MSNQMDKKDFVNILWEYFSLHANQRIQLINFYIILETFLVAGLFTVYGMEGNYDEICIVISIAIIFFSFIFFNLDTRTKQMIKYCENALKSIEKKYKETYGKEIMIFSLEEEQTKSLRDEQSLLKRWFLLSYTRSFTLMFIFFSLVGVISIIYSIWG